MQISQIESHFLSINLFYTKSNSFPSYVVLSLSVKMHNSHVRFSFHYFFVYFSVHIIISHAMCHYYDIVSFALFEQRNIKLKSSAIKGNLRPRY